MLIDPKFIDKLDSMLNAIGIADEPKRLYKGVYEIGHFNMEYMLDIHGLDYGECYPQFRANDFGFWFSPYGIVDTPKQFIKKFRKQLKKDERSFVVSMTHIEKNPENAGKGGGFRWHKWGPYYGSKKPRREYLDDEAGFKNGVYVYHVFQVSGPVIQLSIEEQFNPRHPVV